MPTNIRIRKKDLIYPELSYEIIGAVYDLHDKLGPGLKEEIYQKSLGIAFKKKDLKFQEQLYTPLVYEGKSVGKRFFDFLVEDKIVVEIKKGSRFVKADIEQLYEYLRSRKLKLGILVYFGTNNVQFKRILNLGS